MRNTLFLCLKRYGGVCKSISFVFACLVVCGMPSLRVAVAGPSVAYGDCYQPCSDEEQVCLKGCGDGKAFDRNCGRGCVDKKISCNKQCTEFNKKNKR